MQVPAEEQAQREQLRADPADMRTPEEERRRACQPELPRVNPADMQVLTEEQE